MQGLSVELTTVRFFIKEAFLHLLKSRFQSEGIIYYLREDFSNLLAGVAHRLELGSIPLSDVLDQLNWSQKDTQLVIEDAVDTFINLVGAPRPQTKEKFLETVSAIYTALTLLYGSEIPELVLKANQKLLFGDMNNLAQRLRASKLDIQRAIHDARLEAQHVLKATPYVPINCFK